MHANVEINIHEEKGENVVSCENFCLNLLHNHYYNKMCLI